MAQGVDVKCLSRAKSPSMDAKPGEPIKRTRGVGSRRIFSPQFKLQVLDSYRNDLDCRGNQRATARKYNIHRRQIQKWLQCEHNLRSSVEDSTKIEITESSRLKTKRKIESEEDKPALTLNQSATTFGRLGDAERLRYSNGVDHIPRLEDKVQDAEEGKTEVRNLKRVAQKLYPSLQGVLCVAEEKIARPSDRVEDQKYFRGDVACAFGLSPGCSNNRDDNYNKLIQTDDRPLDLKSKVRSEILPEECLVSNVESTKPDSISDKLRIGGKDGCQLQLTSSSENIGGQKLSVPDTVLKCLVQKYNMGDIKGQELCDRQCVNNNLLRSSSVNRMESSCLLDIEGPKNFDSVPDASNLIVKRKSEGNEDRLGAFDSESCHKKSKTETIILPKVMDRLDGFKSFSPKRKWMKESMQEMLDDSMYSQEPSSLPIKQRVKLNLRSLPETKCNVEACNKPSRISSNFTIEKLCSTDCSREKVVDCSNWQFSPCNLTTSVSFAPPPLVLPNRVIPDLVSLHFNPDMYNKESGLATNSYSPNCCPLEVPHKEEKLSDNEGMDVDIMSTTPVEKKSFDFSNYNFGKRRSFSVQFKLTVLDAFYNDKDCNKNQRATARKFNINRRQVQKWLSQETDLRSEGSIKNGKYLQRQRLGGEPRDVDECTKCPQHCFRKKEEVEAFSRTIEVNVKPCSNNECLSGGAKFESEFSKSTFNDGVDFYSKTLFPDDMKPENFYKNYFFSDNNMVYHDSILGWPHLSPSALTVPNFQYLSTWHQNFGFCHENPKIY